VQLFDLGKDPYEQTDLADSQPERLNGLRHRMELKLTEQNALYPVDQDGKALAPR
jgi:arylsulfatase A-like enzyme